MALADLPWPLDPLRVEGRDESTVARALVATPLRTDPATGALRPGLCSRWTSDESRRRWRLTCRHAPGIAAALRRGRLLAADAISIAAPSNRLLTVELRRAHERFPFVLTALAAAPRGVPGPFRLVSGSRMRIVARRGSKTLIFRKLTAAAAVRAFREGRVDEAPVPRGDLAWLRADPVLRGTVRARQLLGLDLVDLGGVEPGVRRLYALTAGRADYAALVSEGVADPASAPAAAADVRRARARARSRARATLTLRVADESLRYGAETLAAHWQEAGLPTRVGRGGEALLRRVIARHPLAVIVESPRRSTPIAWVHDARLVSPRLRGWREDALGNVDYRQVRVRS